MLDALRRNEGNASAERYCDRNCDDHFAHGRIGADPGFSFPEFPSRARCGTTPAAMSLRRGALFSVILLGLGCSIDFERYRATPYDGGATPIDRPVAPTDNPVVNPTDTVAPATDNPVAPTDRPVVPTDVVNPNPPCPRPFLAVTVENLRGGPGQVLRIPLSGSAMCAPLSAVFQQPMGITQLGDGSLAVAARDGVALLDPDTGAQRGRVDFGEDQAGILGVMRWSPAGASGYAVAFTWTGSSEPQTRSLVAYDGSNRVGPVMLPPNVRYVTSHPTQGERYLAVRDVAGMTVIDAVDNTGATTRWLDNVSFLQAAHTVFTTSQTYTAAVTWSVSTMSSNAILTNATRPAPVPITYRQTVQCSVPGCTRFYRGVQVADDVAVVLCNDNGSGPLRLVRTRPVAGNDCQLLDGSTLGTSARMSDLTLVAR